MSLAVIAAGPLGTIQDAGRFGYRAFGVPASGPFDRRSAAVANALVSNPPGAAVVELTAFGGAFRADSDLAIALAGAPMVATVERGGEAVRTLSIPCASGLRRGDHLTIGASAIGYRCYLATRGGWIAPESMGSRSNERRIVPGDRLFGAPGRTDDRRTESGRISAEVGPIRYVDGPDAAECDHASLNAAEYRLRGDSDRIGLRLDGPALAIATPADRLSIPVAPGAIQVAGGLPIVLGPACGTMGGYPNIGYVASADLDRLGQARPGQAVRFERIGIEDARAIDRDYRRAVANLALRLRVASS